MENPFEFHEEDTIIACVGDNGGTTDEDIRNGFKRTVELLTESLKTGSEVEDLLVYPIVYNARHSIELSLKIVIKMLWRIEEKKGICYSEEVLKERKKELHTHSIECLYKLACDKKNIDRRIPAYFENIEDMSNSFLAVEHLEEVHDDIVSKAFDGTYLIRKLKQRNICLRILYGMKKCGQVTYAKQLSAALEQEGVELTL